MISPPLSARSALLFELGYDLLRFALRAEQHVPRVLARFAQHRFALLLHLLALMIYLIAQAFIAFRTTGLLELQAREL